MTIIIVNVNTEGCRFILQPINANT